MTKEEYINWLAPRVVLDSLNWNLLPSPRIAQGCFEPAYGTSDLAIFAKNLFGVKANDQWEGKCYNKASGECYDGKNYVSKNSDFQAYDSWDDSIYWQGWYLVNRCTTPKYHPELKHYAELIGNRDYKDCARILQEKKYGTSPEYAQRVITYVEKHDLTRFDTMTREEAEQMIRNEKGGGKKMVINVHAGHNPDGMVACGAIGLVKESTENRKIKHEVIRLLRTLGHTVYDCTCDNGTSVNDVLKKIVAKCNEHTVDLDVSLHLNSGAEDLKGDGATKGVEVLVYGINSKAIPYAKNVCSAISALGYKNRGIKYRPDLYVLRKTKAAAMLIEAFFADDKDDVDIYDYKRIAEAIVFGITGEKVNEPVVEDKPVETGKKEQFYIAQAGKYREKSGAERKVAQLKAAGFDALVRPIEE